MSISSEITALNTNLTAAKDAVTAKGGTVGDTGLAGLATEIATIPSGGGDYNATMETTAVSSYTGTGGWGALRMLTEIPTITIDSSMTTLLAMFSNASGIESATLTGGSSSLTNIQELFYNCTSLTNVNLANLTVGSSLNLRSLFASATVLTDISLPAITSVSNLLSTFNGCAAITSLDLSGWDTSSCSDFYQCFRLCSSLKTLNISGWTNPNSQRTFQFLAGCTALESLIIDSNEVFNLTDSNSISSSGIAYGRGYVYVPDNLVASYQAANYWSTYSSQIKGMSEYTG